MFYNSAIISVLFFAVINVLSAVQSDDGVTQKGHKGSKSNEAIMYYNHGDTLRSEGRFEEAINQFHLAMSLDNGFIEVYDNLGLAYQNMGNIDSAVYYYEKSLQLYSEGINSNFNLSILYMQMNEFEKAKKLLTNLVNADSNSARGYYGLANINLMKGEFKECIVNIDMAIDLFKRSNSDNIGQAYLIKGFAFANNNMLDSARVYIKLAESSGMEIPEEARQLLNTNEKSDQEMLALINKLLDTPIDKIDDNEFKALSKELMIWIPKKQRGTILLSEPLITTNTCYQCIAVFMAAWSKYHIEVGDNDLLEGAYYTIKTSIDYYQDNREFLETNEIIEGFIKAQEEGNLKQKVDEALSKFEINQNLEEIKSSKDN